jgi:hypothetical protein
MDFEISGGPGTKQSPESNAPGQQVQGDRLKKTGMLGIGLGAKDSGS